MTSVLLPHQVAVMSREISWGWRVGRKHGVSFSSTYFLACAKRCWNRLLMGLNCRQEVLQKAFCVFESDGPSCSPHPCACVWALCQILHLHLACCASLPSEVCTSCTQTLLGQHYTSPQVPLFESFTLRLWKLPAPSMLEYLLAGVAAKRLLMRLKSSPPGSKLLA